MSEQKYKVVRYSPQGALTIYTAEEQKNNLIKALEGQKVVEVDLSKVTEMDTAGLQLLILAKLESESRSLPFTIVGHSQAALEVMDLCNMSGFFGDQVFIPSENPVRGGM